MNKKNIFYLILSISLFLWIVFYIYNYSKTDNLNPNCSYDYVEQVYDGDTVKAVKLWKVRLLWIDAPEVYHPWWTVVKSYKFFWCWNEAKKIADKYLLHKKLLFCKWELSQDKWKYWRKLRYVMIKTWNTLIPFWKYLLETWYAKVYKYANSQYKKEYLKIEKYNKLHKKWVWSKKCIQEDKKFKDKYLK